MRAELHEKASAAVADPQGLPCVGRDPVLFTEADTAALAVGLCADCPALAWCLDRVDPARSFFDGVAGGVEWRDGEPILRHPAGPELRAYLAAAERSPELQLHNPKRDPNRIDPVAVRLFLAGDVSWEAVTLEERLVAARHLLAAGGLTRNEVLLRCHLSTRLLREIEGSLAA